MPHVTFIHGIANKPEEKKLKKIWLDALAQDPLNNDDAIDLGALGITTSMIYWADVLYDKPMEDAIFESVSNYESNEAIISESSADPDMAWREHLSGDERKMVDSLASKLSFDVLMNDDAVPDEKEMARTLERIPLPWFVKRRLMKWLLKDVHHYLFNKTFSPRAGVSFIVQDEIRSRVLNKLNEVKTDLHIVISHSMGTVIIYDCLKRVAECPAIDGLMTIGSPLGIDEVQDKFAPEWNRENGFAEKIKGPWINVYDSFDPVAGFDGNIANDYKLSGEEVIEVINEQNWGSWRHNITNYLSGPKLRAALKGMLKL
ncbi:hypothetical protein DU508_02825 [Pedobacter chinensis]|uniref:Alpha/beta hydrolase n=1 Tax=Pedobacter chinensis TaxID=2282421 RepID=A0A369PZ44_9SPHI|nr:hypothetical protein [Pedobacter chinensis]RDC57903.1 hypothetical protein DU508_02825 [Pedobacter chinensis]